MIERTFLLPFRCGIDKLDRCNGLWFLLFLLLLLLGCVRIDGRRDGFGSFPSEHFKSLSLLLRYIVSDHNSDRAREEYSPPFLDISTGEPSSFKAGAELEPSAPVAGAFEFESATAAVLDCSAGFDSVVGAALSLDILCALGDV